MLDFHLTHAIANGFKYYKENQEAFRQIFTDVSESYADKLFDKMNNVNITFNTAFQKKYEKLPLITMSIEENTDDTQNQVLGNRGYNEATVLFVNQRCDVNIYTDDVDLLRAFHRIIQTTLLLFKKDFFKVGYLNIEFVKSSDLMPEDDITSKDVVVYKRMLTFNAQKELKAFPINQTIDNVTWELLPTITQI